MPYAAQLDLTGKHPVDTFSTLMLVDSTGSLFDGTGNQITDINVTASQAISASYEIIYETSSSYADFADSSSFTTSASYSSASFSSSYANTSSFAETFDHRVTGSVLFGDPSNVATLYIEGSPSTGGKTGLIQSNPAGLVLDHNGGTIYFSKPLEMGNHDINSTGHFNSTASYSDSGSYALTSSYISPNFGAVTDVSNATGSSAGTAGFTDAAELGAFILAVSSSFETLNSLIAKLRAAGIIT